MKPKLCYVMPEYNPNSATHLAYLSDFVRSASKIFDIFLIIERGVIPEDNLGCREVKIAESKNPFYRLIKVEAFLWRARCRGYKDFYVHYSFYSAYIASWIAIFSGGRVFYWNCGEPWKYERNFLRDLFERLVYKMVDFLVTGTQGFKIEYSRHYGIPDKKIKVMPNWIDLKKFKSQIFSLREISRRETNLKFQELRKKLSINSSQRIILFIHRLSKRKGAHYLPEILNYLRDQDIVLVVIGEGPEEDNLKSQISNLKLNDKVRLLGAIPNNLLPNYYQLADVFIMPSDEEGFPHVLLEAMAAGVPFVATRVGGVKEIVPKEMFEYVVEARDIKGFTAKTNLLLSKSELQLKQLKGVLMDWVRNYDLNKIAPTFKNIFN